MKHELVALAISVTPSNADKAIRTVKEVTSWIPQNQPAAWVGILPVERTIANDNIVEGLSQAAWPMKMLIVDAETIQAIIAAVPRGAPTPLYRDFNFAVISNAAQIAALALGANTLLRCDPGVSPPGMPFHDVMKTIDPIISTGALTSGQYVGRLALRYKHLGTEQVPSTSIYFGSSRVSIPCVRSQEAPCLRRVCPLRP